MCLISVIMPIYNMEQYLNRALDSILNQDYENFELILVNDGSTDNCGQICEEYSKKEKKIKVLHKKNGGLSSARNLGMEHAQGEYVIFPDPDDWVDIDYLSFLHNLQIEGNVDLAICGHYVIDDSGILSQTTGEKKTLNQEEAIYTLFQSDAYCGFSCNKLYKKSIIQDNELKFDLELGMAQDLHFAFRYFLNSEKFIYDPQPKYYYFQHVGGVTNSPLTPRKISGLTSFSKMKEIAEKEFPSVVSTIDGTIVNMSISFIEKYFESQVQDEKLLNILHKNIQENFKTFFFSRSYSYTRKMQGLIAYISPKKYFNLKLLVKKSHNLIKL